MLGMIYEPRPGEHVPGDGRDPDREERMNHVSPALHRAHRHRRAHAPRSPRRPRSRPIPPPTGGGLYLDKAQCSFCHGWAADGAGEPQSNGGAANLRQSFLNRDQLIEVIMCGRPGTPMPHYDELAYTDKRCYDVTEAELGAQRALPASNHDAAEARDRGGRGLSARQGDRSRSGHAGGMRGDVRARRPFLRPVSEQAVAGGRRSVIDPIQLFGAAAAGGPSFCVSRHSSICRRSWPQNSSPSNT